MARALMLQGTGSDVGKTVLVAGLCRAARRRGLRVVPFKPQNMSNNAAVADADEFGRGGEIGRAQWLQALASGVAANVDMNPVLLKPQSDHGAQVVVHGKVVAMARAREYQKLKPQLLGSVMESSRGWRRELILFWSKGPAHRPKSTCATATSPIWALSNAPAFRWYWSATSTAAASLPRLSGRIRSCRQRTASEIAGYLINKFRGDISLFADGIAAIERFTGWRSFGILPFLDCVRRLPAEDSVALERLSRTGKSGRMVVAVPVTGRIANFDDLDPLRAEPELEVRFVRKGERLPADAALIVLPGLKTTIADLAEFRANGWEAELKAHVARGGRVIGICGGYQMLGRHVRDPDGIEGTQREIAGLGLLDVETVIEGEKTVRNVAAQTADGVALEGYEIHLGRTDGLDCARPMIRIDGRPDGATSADGRVSGCYLHGLFGADEYRARLLAELGVDADPTAWWATVEAALDELAGAIETHVDVDGLLAAASEV